MIIIFSPKAIEFLAFIRKAKKYPVNPADPVKKDQDFWNSAAMQTVWKWMPTVSSMLGA